MLFIITGSHKIDKRKCYVHRRTENKPQISGQLKSSKRTWRVRQLAWTSCVWAGGGETASWQWKHKMEKQDT